MLGPRPREIAAASDWAAADTHVGRKSVIELVCLYWWLRQRLQPADELAHLLLVALHRLLRQPAEEERLEVVRGVMTVDQALQQLPNQ